MPCRLARHFECIAGALLNSRTLVGRPKPKLGEVAGRLAKFTYAVRRDQPVGEDQSNAGANRRRVRANAEWGPGTRKVRLAAGEAVPTVRAGSGSESARAQKPRGGGGEARRSGDV